jgi:transposase
VSTAAVALKVGVNANLLHRWVREAGHRAVNGEPKAVGAASVATKAQASLGHGLVPAPLPRFIALAPPPSPTPPSIATAPAAGQDQPAPPPVIFVELHRADTSIYVTWPVSAAAEASTWLRDLPALLK